MPDANGLLTDAEIEALLGEDLVIAGLSMKWRGLVNSIHRLDTMQINPADVNLHTAERARVVGAKSLVESRLMAFYQGDPAYSPATSGQVKIIRDRVGALEQFNATATAIGQIVNAALALATLAVGNDDRASP
ncbi:MAG: hypothetical protein K2P94_15580 [Rhodospirillaceae bacterium]|nr:hypothetical protein [Rhodospirillaceae bacterium]